MSRRRQRKCRHCGQLYEPDPRNAHHQRYCSQPACRLASKAAGQARWRASPKGRDKFRGQANVLRVQAWRKADPGYRRKAGENPNKPSEPPRKKSYALQDDCAVQALVPPANKPSIDPRALQDVMLAQGLIVIGLVSQLTGSPLQDDIARTTRRLPPAHGLDRQDAR